MASDFRDDGRVIVAIDVGTSSVRASVYDAEGRRLDGYFHQESYEAATTTDGGSEHDADLLLQAAARCVDRVLAGPRLPAILGVGVTTASSTLVAALTDTEPVAVVGRGSGIDDNAWMRKAAAIRDALRRARPVITEPLALLRTVGGADLAAIAGFLAQAAVRRTPVLLDGLAVCAAALLAEELAPGARAWWMATHRTTEPAHALALEHLDLSPLVDFGIAEGAGTGAAALVPLLSMAATLRRTPV